MDTSLGTSNLSGAQSVVVVRICASVSLAILYYDYALTIGAEVERFWMRRRSLVSHIFFLNRYLALIGHIPVIYEFFWVHDTTELLIAAIQIVIGVLQLFRTYALYSQSRRVLSCLCAFGLIASSVAIWAVTNASEDSKGDPSKAVPTFGCEAALSETGAHFLAVAWSVSLAYDALMFALTLYKTLHAVYNRATRSSLSTLLLRDGAFYFGILLLCNVANILTLILPQLPPPLRGISVNRTTTISTSLMARLMLNIRDPAMREPQLSEPPPSAAPTWEFVPVALDTFSTELGSSEATYLEAQGSMEAWETGPAISRGPKINGRSWPGR
ncbi:hypothetical protein BD309DRAFT_483972 [Dichomitus squalens]|nr:hypothetical protein BD309DRAFT_483972 [Dichomitus squalens]